MIEGSVALTSSLTQTYLPRLTRVQTDREDKVQSPRSCEVGRFSVTLPFPQAEKIGDRIVMKPLL
jgi:hypothetical protein